MHGGCPWGRWKADIQCALGNQPQLAQYIMNEEERAIMWQRNRLLQLCSLKMIAARLITCAAQSQGIQIMRSSTELSIKSELLLSHVKVPQSSEVVVYASPGISTAHFIELRARLKKYCGAAVLKCIRVIHNLQNLHTAHWHFVCLTRDTFENEHKDDLIRDLREQAQLQSTQIQGPRLLLVHEKDPKRGGSDSFADCISGIPNDLRFDSVALPLYESTTNTSELRDTCWALIAKVLLNGSGMVPLTGLRRWSRLLSRRTFRQLVREREDEGEEEEEEEEEEELESADIYEPLPGGLQRQPSVLKRTDSWEAGSAGHEPRIHLAPPMLQAYVLSPAPCEESLTALGPGMVPLTRSQRFPSRSHASSHLCQMQMQRHTSSQLRWPWISQAVSYLRHMSVQPPLRVGPSGEMHVSNATDTCALAASHSDALPSSSAHTSPPPAGTSASPPWSPPDASTVHGPRSTVHGPWSPPDASTSSADVSAQSAGPPATTLSQTASLYWHLPTHTQRWADARAASQEE